MPTVQLADTLHTYACINRFLFVDFAGPAVYSSYNSNSTIAVTVDPLLSQGNATLFPGDRMLRIVDCKYRDV